MKVDVSQMFLPLSLARRVDAVCCRFEAAWRDAAAGTPPEIEVLLAGAAEPERSALAVELIRLDALYRRRAGESVAAAGYKSRFPSLDPSWIARAVTGVADTVSQGEVTPDTETATPVATVEKVPAVPATVAGYEILDVLGRGGMGVVYRARHLKLQRVVALKMILAGEHAGAEELARFRSEAEAVARLSHRNIVQIYEVGEQDGRPYCSLEYLESGNLAEKLGGTPLPARAAAQLVERLARAVQAAHQQGIIHRDLKPANVLLARSDPIHGVALRFGPDQSGCYEPKITDFGLAKRLEGDSGQTRTGAIMGTPSYMAPEQAEGRTHEIGPLADVYALGAILYELLTGRPPFRGATTLETLRQVSSDEPVAPCRLQSQVPRDVETICLKCLHKDPTRRYADAAALADDLRRFLGGEPIAARPVSAWERAIKWTRRRPAAAALLLVSAVAFVLVITTLAISNVRIADEKARAEENYHTAAAQRELAQKNLSMALDAVEKMLTEVAHDRLKNLPHMEQVQRRLLEDALSFYRKFLADQGTDPAVRLGTARAYRVVADIYRTLGKQDEAEEHYRQAEQLLEQLAAERFESAEVAVQTAATYGRRARLRFDTDRLNEGKADQERAVELMETLAANYPDNLTFQSELAFAYLQLGETLGRLSQPEEDDFCRKARGILLKLVADSPADADLRLMLSVAYHGSAVYTYLAGRPQEAQPLFREALALLEELVAEHPNEIDYLSDLANTSTWLAGLLVEQHQLVEAERLLSKSRELYTRLSADFPTIHDFQRQLAAVHHSFGFFYHDCGRFEDATVAFRESIARLEKLLVYDSLVPVYRSELGNSHRLLSLSLDRLDRPQEAEQALLKAVAAFEGLVRAFPSVPEYREQLAATWQNRGEHDQKLKNYPEAVDAFRQSEDLSESLIREHPLMSTYRADMANTLREFASALEAVGQTQEAAKKFTRSLDLCMELITSAPQDASHYLQLALTHLAMKNHVQATESAEKLPRLTSATAVQYYDAACLYSRSIRVAEQDASLSDLDRTDLTTRYSDRAIELVRNAIDEGFENYGRLTTAPDLDPLRSHPEFIQLMAKREQRARMVSP